ncbi:MAG TPA: protoporphyrinogen oxidase [Verrucomicrobiae bacterium]|nr:protoporphyrinogen oxidase [Verrucomicrobiae bacterium]
MGIDRQTVVIGGGISGLACAYRLQRLGSRVTLLEASDRVGGMIATERRNGFLFEAGPQCPRFPRAVWELVRELGLEREFLRADSRAKRYVVKHGKLYQAPFSLWAFLSTPLVGLGAKLRLVTEPLRRWQPPASEESIAAFVRRKFGAQMLDYLVDPFVSAVFFADPDQMAMDSAVPSLPKWEREYGSVFHGALKSRKAKNSSQASTHLADFLPPLGSFRTGLAALPDKLAERLGTNVRLRAQVESVEVPTAGSWPNWRIRLRGGEELAAESVVVAAPAYAAAAMLQRGAPQLSSALQAISYAPLVVVSSAYARSQVRHSLDGFGVMFPRREGLHAILTTWTSSLFAGRAPEDKVLLTTFARPMPHDTFLDLPNGAIGAVVEDEVGSILDVSGAPVERMVWKHAKALPQFQVGHAQRVAAIRESARVFPGLYLAGNYFRGRSLDDCVESGFNAAEEAHAVPDAAAACVQRAGRT